MKTERKKWSKEKEMYENSIDILEEAIFKKDPVILERLLWDQSRPTDSALKNDLNHDGHHHIYWATDNYQSEGDGFGFFDEIQISSITGERRTLVRPRAAKTKEEQEQRTREKAEVFTPSWICNAQNNLADEAWFGRKDVFNHENEDNTWTTNNEPIEFPEGKTWKEYVGENRLEITCGEAPYLVSRYDTTTGKPIELRNRIGLFDRKMRVLRENVSTLEDWWKGAEMAIKSTYGFEWQGDNLLLAREALLLSVQDYYMEFCQENNIPIEKYVEGTKEKARYFAYIISWNIWQMDGLKCVLPMTCHEEEEKPQAIQLSILDPIEEVQPKKIACKGCQKNDPHQHNGIYARVADWDNEHEEPIEIIEFHRLLPPTK